MRHRVESKREKRHSKCTFTVMLHGRVVVSGGFLSFWVSKSAVMSLSAQLAIWPDVTSYTLTQSGLLSLLQQTPSPDQTRRRPLSQIEKFSAEEPVACSALAALAASPNTGISKSGATPTKTLMEQNCCAATY